MTTMNVPKVVFLAVTMLAALSAATASAAPIAPGNIIGFDFSDSKGATTNWLTATTANAFGPTNVVDAITGLPIDGVQVSFGGATGENNLGDQLTNTAIPLTAAQDGVWRGPGSIDVTFTGLDTSLLYTVNMYALVRNEGNRTVDFTASGASTNSLLNQGRQMMYDAYEASGTPVASFQNIAPDEFGTLILTFSNASDFFTASALTLEATSALVPEPDSMQLLGAMMVLAALSLWGWRRRQRQA